MADAVVIKPHRPWTQRNVNASEGLGARVRGHERKE